MSLSPPLARPGETVSGLMDLIRQAGSTPARERITGASDFAPSLLVVASFVCATAPIALTSLDFHGPELS